MNNQRGGKTISHVVKFVQDAIEHNKRTGEYLETILNELGGNTPEDHKTDLQDIRNMNSMRMIESILDNPKTQNKTFQFVSGLKDHLNERNQLSESQRFHLESTYNSVFGW